MALQHLRSSTAHKRPIPTVMSAGQIAINTNEASPGLFFKDSNGDLVKVGPVHIGTTAPNSSPASVAATALVTGTIYQILTVGTSDFTLVGASANTVGTIFTATGTTTGTGTVSGQQGVEKGEQWLDTTGGAYDLKIYDGTDWRSQAGEFVNATGDTMTGDLVMNNANIVFEGATADDFETTLTVTDPTADRTIALPDVSGDIVTTGDTGTVTSTMILDGTIANADISSTAEIAVSKLANGTTRQLLQTDAAGTGVEFTSNVDVPGTLDVTGDATFDGAVHIYDSDAVSELWIQNGPNAVSTHNAELNFGNVKGNGRIGYLDSGNNFMHFIVNSSEVMRLKDYDGNGDMRVSLGSSSISTSSMLKVNGTSTFTDNVGVGIDPAPLDLSVNGDFGLYSGTTEYGKLFNDSSVLHLRAAANMELALGTEAQERLRIDSSGNVGIGTDSPASLLTSYVGSVSTLGAKASTGLLIENNGSSGNISQIGLGYTFASTYHPVAIAAITDSGSGSTRADLHFATRSLTTDTAPDTRMIIKSDGNVGIGTQSPTPNVGNGATLHLSGASTTSEVRLTRGNGTDVSITAGSTSGGCGIQSSEHIGFSTNGANERIRIDSSGTFRVKGAGTAGVNDAVQLNGSAPANSLLLDASGRLLVGTTSARSNTFNSTFVGGQLQIETAGTSGGAAQFGIYGGSSGTAFPGPIMVFGAHKSATVGGNGLLSSGDRVGLLTFQGNDGAEFVETARIEALVDGTPGSNDMPGRLVFSTTADGYSNPGEAMQINRHGQLLVTSGGSPAFTGTNARIYAKSSATLIVAEGNSAGYTEGAFLTVAPSLARGGGIYMFNSNSGGTNSEWYAGRPYSAADYYVIARATSVSTPGSTTAQISNALFEISNSGNAILQGTLTQSGSDDRLKTNRTALTSALTKVESLEGFTFNWNQDAIDNYGFSADDGTLVGMSAQELQLVLPEAVKTVTHTTSVDDPTSGNSGEEDTYLTIQYERVVPLLVEAIKELSAQKSSLEARVAALEAS